MNLKNENLTFKEKVGYGLGDAASSMFWKLFGMYLMFFYTDVFGMEAKVVGTMFLITRVWDSLFDPIVGIIADRTQSKWGRFRPYLLYVAIPFGVLGMFTFYTPAFSDWGKIIYAYLTYSIMMMVYSAINVPYASLLGVISPLPKERNILATYRMTFAYIGSFLTLLLFNPLINYFSARSSDAGNLEQGWFMAATVIALFSTLLFLLCFAWTRERVKPLPSNARSTLKQDIRDLAKNKPWWILLGAGVAALLFNSIRDGAALYYFKYYIQEEKMETIMFLGIPFVWSGLYLALGQMANIVGVVMAGPVSNSIGKRTTYIVSMSLAAILSLLFFTLQSNQLIWIFVFQILISICAGAIFPLLWSMYADCADYSEYRTGNRATGLIFSSSSMSQKLGWALGTAITGWLLAYFGFQANQTQSREAMTGIKMFLSLLPACGAILSVLIIIFYPLGEQKVAKITLLLEKMRESRSS